MSTKLVAAATAALFASLSLAHAATQTETGVIAQIDTKAPTITLASGNPKQFWVNKDVNIASFKAGDKVIVSYDMVNNKALASAVRLAQ